MMSMEYCHRGDHFIDLDYDYGGRYFDGEWCCWHHLTEEEQAALLEKDGDAITKKLTAYAMLGAAARRLRSDG